jgi:hypothetical protein
MKPFLSTLSRKSASRELEESMVEWLHDLDAWAVALTITFKRHDHHGRPVSQQIVDQTARHFVNTLNQVCFGRRKARKGFTVGIAVSYGWGTYEDHPHLHISLASPKHISVEQFYDEINKALTACNWINEHRRIARYRDVGWTQYLVDHGTDQVLLDLVRRSHPA